MGGSNGSEATMSDDRGNDANKLLAGGIGIGAIGVLGALTGAVCPVCVVAAPVLLGAGAYKKWRAAAAKTEAASSSSSK